MERVPLSEIVAITLAPRADSPEATEFLRVLVSLRACGRSVALFELGRGVGSLSSDPDMSADGSRYLEALAEEGVAPQAPAGVAAALARANALLLLPNRERTGRPALLRLTLKEAPTPETLELLTEAGQATIG